MVKQEMARRSPRRGVAPGVAALTGSALSLAGCAHGDAGAPAEIYTPAMRAIVQRALDREATCLILPFEGTGAAKREDGFSLIGTRRADGGYDFVPAMRTALDALTEAGLLTVGEQAGEQPRGAPARRFRLYSFTALGRLFYRGAEAMPVPSYDSGAARLGGFCYGSRRLVSIVKLTPIRSDKCATSRRADVLYRYSAFPEWIDHPSVRAAFPESPAGRDQDVVRWTWLPLMLRDGQWEYGFFDYVHSYRACRD
jgi:hypothetical protein